MNVKEVIDALREYDDSLPAAVFVASMSDGEATILPIFEVCQGPEGPVMEVHPAKGHAVGGINPGPYRYNPDTGKWEKY